MATFGKIVAGGTDIKIGWHSSFVLCKQTMPEYGIITKITAWVKWGDMPDNGIGVIFSHDSVNNRPGTLLAQGDNVSLVPNQFNDFPGLSHPVAKGTVIWIGYYMKTNHWCLGDSGETNQTWVWAQGTFPTVPTTYAPVGPGYFFTADLEASINATYTPTAAPPQGTLEVHAYEDGVEVGASVESEGKIYTTPFTIPLNVGLYTLNATYGIHPIQTQTVEILEGQTTIVDFNFVLPPTHLLTVDSAPVQGVPFTIEKVS